MPNAYSSAEPQDESNEGEGALGRLLVIAGADKLACEIYTPES
jgi:hypothetical protein